MTIETQKPGLVDRAAVEDCLNAHGEDIARFHVRSLELFGSAVRGVATDNSDIDLLVTFDGPIDLLSFIELEEILGELLGSCVDLVPRESLKPLLAESILAEAVRVY
jgi:uncharacterized protein